MLILFILISLVFDYYNKCLAYAELNIEQCTIQKKEKEPRSVLKLFFNNKQLFPLRLDILFTNTRKKKVNPGNK